MSDIVTHQRLGLEVTGWTAARLRPCGMPRWIHTDRARGRTNGRPFFGRAFLGAAREGSGKGRKTMGTMDRVAESPIIMPLEGPD